MQGPPLREWNDSFRESRAVRHASTSVCSRLRAERRFPAFHFSLHKHRSSNDKQAQQ